MISGLASLPDMQAMGYRATWEKKSLSGRVMDVLVVHDVPIFCVCKRDELVIDEKWIARAVSRAKRKEREGYLPPLHIRHHETATEMNDAVRGAGFFRVTGAKPLQLDGKVRLAVVADLIVTDPQAQDEVLSMKYPYRSVELFDPKNRPPSIDGLALLDHEAPFLELPMLLVADVNGSATRDNRRFRAGTLVHWKPDQPVVACFKKGEDLSVLSRFAETTTPEGTDMTEPKTTLFSSAEPAPVDEATMSFADDGEPKKKDDDKDETFESEEGGGMDVGAIVAAIESGEISVADMKAILEAIAAQEAVDEPDEVEAAPAPVPGEAMKKGDMTQRFAALQGEHDAMRAEFSEMKKAQQRERDVAEALARLEGRALGADLEEKLVNFHTEHGGAAFRAYVDAMATSIAVLPGADSKTETFRAQDSKIPAVAMKYQDSGPDAVERAAEFARQWEELKGTGMRCSQEAYVQLYMARETAQEI